MPDTFTDAAQKNLEVLRKAGADGVKPNEFQNRLHAALAGCDYDAENSGTAPPATYKEPAVETAVPSDEVPFSDPYDAWTLGLLKTLERMAKAEPEDRIDGELPVGRVKFGPNGAFPGPVSYEDWAKPLTDRMNEAVEQLKQADNEFQDSLAAKGRHQMWLDETTANLDRLVEMFEGDPHSIYEAIRARFEATDDLPSQVAYATWAQQSIDKLNHLMQTMKRLPDDGSISPAVILKERPFEGYIFDRQEIRDELERADCTYYDPSGFKLDPWSAAAFEAALAEAANELDLVGGDVLTLKIDFTKRDYITYRLITGDSPVELIVQDAENLFDNPYRGDEIS